MVRVVVTDFLPFVKTVFESLYSQGKVSQLALACSALALKHQVSTAKPLTSARSGSSSLDIKMELDLKDLATPLKSVAPDVFEEMEAIAAKKHLRQQELATVSQDVKEEVADQEVGAAKEELQETVGLDSQSAAASKDQEPSPSVDTEPSQPTAGPQNEELSDTAYADTSALSDPLV